MGDPQNGRGLRRMAIALLSGLCLLALPSWSIAQSNTPSAELKRVVGRVEILAKGQTQWIPAVVGARLAAGDDIRAYSGASAELTLPDTSTVVLTENSRLLMSKMEYDSQGQGRLMLLHLVVGKVRATVAQAAVSLARDTTLSICDRGLHRRHLRSLHLPVADNGRVRGAGSE